MRFELREFNGTSFGEGFEQEDGPDLAAFEDYCRQFSDGDELEDEPARPFKGIVAGRCFKSNRGTEMSAFAYQNEE